MFLNLKSQIRNEQKKLLSKEYLEFIEKGKIVENQSENLSVDEKLNSLLVLAENYLAQGLYKESVKYVFQAEQLAENSESESLKAYTGIVVSAFYRKLELFRKAKEALDKAVQPMSLIKDETEKNYVAGRYQLESGLLELAVSKGDSGISKLWKSKSKFDTLEKGRLKNICIQLINNELANCYLQDENEIDSSFYYFELNLQAESDTYFQQLAKNGIIRFYLKKGRHEKALSLVSQMSPNLSEINSIRSKIEIYKTIAQIYYEKGDVENYKKYNQNYLRLNDSIYKIDKETRLLVIGQLEKNVSEPTEKAYSFYWIWFVLGIAMLGFGVTYQYHVKVKKEYARFLEIMQKLEAKENSEALVQTSEISGVYTISEKTEQVILDKLKKFEESEKYLNPKMSLNLLAKILETNTKYLSEIVNKNKGMNFNHYINELRINYILRKLKTEHKYQNYKVSSLAEECGFGSRNTFTSAFKNYTGMSPATFIGFIKKENHQKF